MSNVLANLDRAGQMGPDHVRKLIAAFDASEMVPPIGAIADYKGNLPVLNARWKNVDRSILLQASYPELFTKLGWQFFLTNPTLTTMVADQGGNSPAAFATANSRTYVGLQAGTWPGLYEYGGSNTVYARPGVSGTSGFVGVLAHPDGRLNQMAFANGYYAALRYTTTGAQQLFTSSDGSTFAQAASIMDTYYPWAIAGGGGRWVAIGSSNFVHTRAGSDPAGGWGSYAHGLGVVAREVYYDNTLSLFILGCSSGNIYTSPTGLTGTWTSRLSTGVAADSISFITRFGGHLFAWGVSTSTGIFRSSDGITWANIRPVGVPVAHKFYFDGARHYIMDATNNVMYVSNDGFATFYVMAQSLFPFTFGASVSPYLGAFNHIWIGNPSGATAVSAMIPIYDYATQFALPAADAGRKQIIRVL